MPDQGAWSHGFFHRINTCDDDMLSQNRDQARLSLADLAEPEKKPEDRWHQHFK